jgi:hypothetical protein
MSQQRSEPRFEELAPNPNDTVGESPQIQAAPKISAPGTSPVGPETRSLGRDFAERPARQHRFNNFVALHWRGEIPLWVSYWIFGFLGNIVSVLFVVTVGAALAAQQYNPRLFLCYLVTIWLGIVAISVWQLVGVWRSANRRIEERKRLGKRAPWASLAKVAMCLGVLRLVSDFLNSGVPQISEGLGMAFLDDPSMPPYALRIMRNGTELEVSGGFKFGLADDLTRVMRATPQLRTIHLDSVGGRIGEGEKLFNLIREHGFTTYVSHQCLSACTLAFAGGRQRWLKSDAKLGFHAGAFAGVSSTDGGIERSIFALAGFDRVFIDLALATPNKDMWYPTTQGLLASRVITNVSNGNDFAASGYGPALTVARLAEQLTSILPPFAELQSTSPSDFKALVETSFADYQNGLTEVEMISRFKAEMGHLIASQIPLADEATLVELVKLSVDEYSLLNSTNPAACYHYAVADGEFDGSLFDKSLIQRELALQQRIIRTASAGHPPVLRASQAVWDKVAAGIFSKVGNENFSIWLDGKATPDKYPAFCQATVALYQEIARLPDADAAAAMRAIKGGK